MATLRVTAPLVNKKIEDHLDDHTKIFNKLLNKHEITLYGENSNDGLCLDFQIILNAIKTWKLIGVGVIVAVIADMVIHLMRFP